MIRIETLDRIENSIGEILPTHFPDGTSQIWKLPEEFLTSNNVKITWFFENEREIIDLGSLRKLLKHSAYKHLHIPFLPYGRQDKEVSNYNTFNLEVLADILNTYGFSLITSVDVHNPQRTAELIHNFSNIEITSIIHKLREQLKPDFIKDLTLEAINNLSTKYAINTGRDDFIGIETKLSSYQKFFSIISPEDLKFFMSDKIRMEHSDYVVYFGKLVCLNDWVMYRYENLEYLNELSAKRIVT